MYDREILELFKAVVADADRIGPINTDWVSKGLVLDFTPTREQSRLLDYMFSPLDVRTIFSREERDNGDAFELIEKQLLNYLETYILGAPGLFDLEVEGGVLVSMTFVRGITRDQLGEMVRELLYRNAPVKDAVVIKNIINYYGVDYDVNKIANNELRIALFDPKTDAFADGDDAVRYIVYVATENTMLIKSNEVIKAVTDSANKISVDFLERHEFELSQVFNRHKRLIMALKNKKNRSVINRISRMSKRNHKPIRESIAKSFVSQAIAGTVDMGVLDQISVRDKMKYLNLLAYKRGGNTSDVFVVRNGKLHLEPGRDVWDKADIDRVEQAVLDSLSRDLVGLKNKKILLDARVRYGLPTSRKQAVGQLPFGTQVTVDSDRISSGIYWENGWGANDLDLSTIDTKGNRTGWGQYSGYDRKNLVTYSGDMTYASPSAMEFMTSKQAEYGLFTNIFSGQPGCTMEIVVGNDSGEDRWMDDVIVRERTNLESRGMVVGFVRDNTYIVWKGRIGNSSVSGGNNSPFVSRGLCESWTVNDLLEHLNIDFDVDKMDKKVYDYDLTYKGFSYDRLEGLLL